jgi:AraC-like DNA-binding protein
VDAVSDALGSLPVTGTLFCRAELRAPWGISGAPTPHAVFHVVLEGRPWIEVRDHGRTHLEAGQMVLIPRGSAHEMEDDTGRDKVPLDRLTRTDDGEPIARLQHGGSGVATRLLCGKLVFDEAAAPLVLGLMPPMLHVALPGELLSWIAATLRMIENASVATDAGMQVVVSKFADILFVQMVRTYLLAPRDGERGWLAAMADPRVAPAMRCIHEQPGERWTVEALAAAAGMSRSVFFERFTELVGESPARYLNRWRMYRACLELRDGASTLDEIAGRVGYESTGAFSKAFKKTMGVSPSAFRTR